MEDPSLQERFIEIKINSEIVKDENMKLKQIWKE
jgi:hypothetical protein